MCAVMKVAKLIIFTTRKLHGSPSYNKCRVTYHASWLGERDDKRHTW